MPVRTSYQTKSEQITTSMTPDLLKDMDKIVDRLGTSRAQFVRDAVASMIHQFEHSLGQAEEKEDTTC